MSKTEVSRSKPVLLNNLLPHSNQETVTDAAQIFKLLVDAVDEYAIFALDSEGFILTWNAGGQRLKGYAPDEVIGSHFSRFYTQVDIERDHPAFELREAAKNGKYEEEGWRVKKDGSQFWANVVITALRDRSGDVVGYGKVTRDLTEKRKVELAVCESEERFRLLVSSVTDYALITLDPEGYISSWNAGAERIKGYRESDILGKHFSSFYPRSEIEAGKPEMELRIATDEGRYEEEGWRVRKDGTMFWANVVITSMMDDTGRLRGFAKITRDLTSRRQAEEALRQSQERYRMLVDNISDYAVIFLDSKGRITSWNSGAAKITGYESKEILGSQVSRFYRPQDLQQGKLENELKQAREKGRFEEEAIRVRRDGSQYWASVVLTSVKDDLGNVLGFSKVIRDISEARKAGELLRESEERFRLMVEGVEDYAIFMLDPTGRVATWNKGAERNKGYSAQEIIGRHFSEFYMDEDRRDQKPERELREAIRNGRFEDEGWRLRKDGSKFWANVVITAIIGPTGHLLGFSKVTRNLTERKRSEDALRDAYAHLEKKVEARTRELSVAKEQAEAAVRTRDEFFSMASHELKTPLASLKLQTQIRKRNIAKGNLKDFAPDRLASLCEEDERQVERLTFLVENMLDISKLTSGNFELVYETFTMNEVVGDVIERMTPILNESGNKTTFTASEEITGTWDRHRIEQVLTNFLSNAGKYAPKTLIEVALERTESGLSLSVADAGRGISEENQRRIFLPGERVHDRGETSGLGLGLYISRQIVDAHHGEIRVESQPGQGSRFIVELPLNSKLLTGNS